MNGSKTAARSKPSSHDPHAAEIKKVFEKFDANKDGVISSDELGRFMQGLGFQVSPDDVQALVKTVDEDCNGTVDFEEFYSLYSSMTGTNSVDALDDKAREAEEEENLKQAFKVFDKDNDGFINVLELQSVLITLSIPEGRSLKKCQQMIKDVDMDGNGRVDFKEFKKMMSSDAFQA